MTRPRILVGGIGNIFFGDDAFGVEVARYLARGRLPENVRVVDFGIRGFDLTCALLDGYDLVILVDTCRRGDEPGTLSVLEPDLARAPGYNGFSGELETHGLVPSKALELAAVMGDPPENIRLVLCEPATLAAVDDGPMRLSTPVQGAVAQALEMIQAIIDEFTPRAHA